MNFSWLALSLWPHYLPRIAQQPQKVTQSWRNNPRIMDVSWELDLFWVDSCLVKWLQFMADSTHLQGCMSADRCLRWIDQNWVSQKSIILLFCHYLGCLTTVPCLVSNPWMQYGFTRCMSRMAWEDQVSVCGIQMFWQTLHDAIWRLLTAPSPFLSGAVLKCIKIH